MTKGLSIPEVAIILLILSSVVGGAMSLIPSKKDVEDVVSVEQKLDKIEEAIFSFYLERGYLPCPASSAVLDSTSTFGVSTDCSASAVSGVTDITPTTVTMTIRNGVVPVRTLNLPDSYMYDPWGSRISYSMVKKLGIDKATYAEVLDVATEVYSIINAAKDLINNLYTSVNKTFVTHTLLSYGKNRNGGATPCVVGSDDHENCNGDNVFKFISHNYVEGSSYYDDHLRWYTNKQLMFGAGLKEEVGGCNTPDINFTPKDVSDLIMWIDASDYNIFTFYSDNNIYWLTEKSDIGNWYDGDGDPTYMPKYEATGFKGKPTMNMTGTKGMFYCPDNPNPISITDKRNMTIFFVGRQDAAAGGNYLLTSNMTNPMTINLNNNGSSTWYSFGSDVASLSASYNNDMYLSLVFNASEPTKKVQAYINGVLTLEHNQYAGFNYRNFFANIGIGRNRANPTDCDFSGKISEMLIYKRALTNSERQYVENYLKAKWGF